VFVNAMMYYKVKDPISAVANVNGYGGSSRLLAATTLRNILGTRTLGDILSDRESIAHEMQKCLDEGTEPWGFMLSELRLRMSEYPNS
jgi:erythrocyte band 7 integral membrane protein